MRKKVLRAAIILTITMMVVYGFIKESSRVYLLNHENNKIKSEIAILERSSTDLKTKTELIKKNDRFLEKIARDELGMIKEEETVYRFDD